MKLFDYLEFQSAKERIDSSKKGNTNLIDASKYLSKSSSDYKVFPKWLLTYRKFKNDSDGKRFIDYYTSNGYVKKNGDPNNVRILVENDGTYYIAKKNYATHDTLVFIAAYGKYDEWGKDVILYWDNTPKSLDHFLCIESLNNRVYLSESYENSMVPLIKKDTKYDEIIRKILPNYKYIKEKKPQRGINN